MANDFLIGVFKDTRQWYQSDAELIASVKNSIAETRFYKPEEYPDFSREKRFDTEICVSKKRSFQAAMDIKNRLPQIKIAVQNFASATNAGGGVKSGSRAQEESLCRCSTLYPVLNTPELWDKFYQMHRDRHDMRYTDIMIRLEKSEFSREERVKLIYDIESLHSFATMINRTRRRDIQDFCVRRSHTISTEFTEYQQQLHDELLEFEKTALAMLHNPRSVAFMMSTIKRQAASCIFGLAPHIRDIIARRVNQLNDDSDVEYGSYNMDGSLGDAISSLAANVINMADNLPPEDPKLEKTLKIIKLKQELPNNKIMLFSTFRHTLAYLKKKLTELGYRVEQVDGGVKDEQRYEFKTRFELPKEEQDAIDILLFTEVGSEGLDYQFCDTMIPWNGKAGRTLYRIRFPRKASARQSTVDSTH